MEINEYQAMNNHYVHDDVGYDLYYHGRLGHAKLISEYALRLRPSLPIITAQMRTRSVFKHALIYFKKLPDLKQNFLYNFIPRFRTGRMLTLWFSSTTGNIN